MTSSQYRDPDPALEERLRSSERYWRSEGREGAPIVAPGADLRELNLRERVLSGAQLQGADLRGALIDHANFLRAALDGARLDGASAFAVSAVRASFVDASLISVQAGRSVWWRARFTRALLDESVFEGADFRGADFVQASLQSTVLQNADLRETSFATADLHATDLTGARVEDALFDEGSLEAAVGMDTTRGAFNIVSPKHTPEPAESAALFELKVSDALRRADVGMVHTVGGAPGQPDFVVMRPQGDYVAIEAKATNDPRQFEGVERIADVVVVPDGIELYPRAATPIVPLRDLPKWVARARASGKGAVALAVREAGRLRPWLAFAIREREDPSFISRMSVWIDEPADFLLTGADRPLSKMVPAHLDGPGFARGVRWAASHLPELRQFEIGAREAWKRFAGDAVVAKELADLGWRLENELAHAISGGER